MPRKSKKVVSAKPSRAKDVGSRRFMSSKGELDGGSMAPKGR